MIRPMSQALRGKVDSAINTTSSNERLRQGLNHLFRFRRMGRYFFIHLDQNTSAKYCSRRHCMREQQSAGSKTPGGKDCDLFGKRR